jgi:hypothetical protein
MNLVLTLLAVVGMACLLPLVSSALRAPLDLAASGTPSPPWLGETEYLNT